MSIANMFTWIKNPENTKQHTVKSFAPTPVLLSSFPLQRYCDFIFLRTLFIMSFVEQTFKILKILFFFLLWSELFENIDYIYLLHLLPEVCMTFTHRTMSYVKLILYIIWGRDPTWFFGICIAHWLSTICWKDYSFSIE